jgi:hypothetical protein
MTFDLLEPISISAIFILSFILIRKNFKVALYLLLAFSVLLHKELFSFYVWDLLPVRMFMFALLCSFAVDVVHKLLSKQGRTTLVSQYFKSTPSLLLIGLWTIYGLSLYFSLNLRASLLLYGFFTCVVVLFIIVLDKLKDNPDVSLKYIKAYIFIALALNIFGYFQLALYGVTGKIIGALWNVPNNIPRIGALFWDINHYGAFLSALLPIACVLTLTEKTKKAKIGYGLVSFSLLAGVLLTNSRSAWIMLFVSFVAFLLSLLFQKYGKKGIILLFTSMLLLAAGIGLAYSQKDGLFRLYVKQYFHYRVDSFDSHMLLLRGSFEIFEKYPILGGGYGGFFEHFSKTDVGPEFFGRDPAAFTTRVPAHTIWGEVLSGSGILGIGFFVLFISLIIGTLFYAARTAKDTRVFLLCSAMSSVLIGWLTAGIFYSYNSEFFWLIWVLFFSYGTSIAKIDSSYKKVIEYFYNSGAFPKIVILTLGAGLIFWSLGATHLIPWDEAIYAKIAKNMVTSGEYISQVWKPQSFWYEKPPLYMWIEALFMSIFGFTSFAARFGSAIFGFLTLVLTYKIAEKLFSRAAAFISVLSLVTTIHFLYYSRAGMLDVTATFFVTLTVYLYLLAKEREKVWYVLCMGAAVGFAAMTKGVVGLLPFPLLFMFELFSKKKLKISSYIYILISFCLIALPWHLEMYRRFGQDFLNSYIGYHVVDRAVTAIEDKGNPAWWYLIILKVSMRVWFISLLAAIPFAIVRLFKKDNRTLPFLIWFFFVLGLFSAAQSKLVWYIIPLYPAAAILNGYFLDSALNFVLERFPKNWRMSLKLISLYILMLFSLTYLVMNKELAYPSDATGSPIRLMKLKEAMATKVTGPDSRVYLDRVELPLALFYLDTPFNIVDFSAKHVNRVPVVSDDQSLVLITKKGRFSETVATYNYPPVVVAEDGDWVLWYMPPRDSIKTSN